MSFGEPHTVIIEALEGRKWSAATESSRGVGNRPTGSGGKGTSGGGAVMRILDAVSVSLSTSLLHSRRLIRNHGPSLGLNFDLLFSCLAVPRTAL